MNLVFPPIIDSVQLIATVTQPPVEIISGMVHQASKSMLGGASKTNKTWILADQAISVAHGIDWLGFPTRQGPVLYINLEIQPFFFAKRLQTIAKAKGVSAIKPETLHTWNLRGFAESYQTFIPKVVEGIRARGYVLVVIDPIYKILGSADENKANEIADLLNKLESITTQAGCAVQYAAHFPKGNMAERESIDRISGSGVFARDPDTIITVTRHKEKECFTVDVTLRNFPTVEPFVIRWKYPLMVRDTTLDPKDIAEPKSGRPKLYQPDELLSLLPSSGFCYTDWCDAAHEKLGISKSTFKTQIKKLDEDGSVDKTNGIYYRVSLGQILARPKNSQNDVNHTASRV